MIPLVDVKRQLQSIKGMIMYEIEQVLDSGQYIMGSKVKELEKEMARVMGVAEVVAVANGTDALVLTLDAYGIGKGDEVITTPFTFFATAEAVSRVGATPVFVDIDAATYNIDPKKIEEKISPVTKAILPVHLFGQPADMDEIKSIASKYDLLVIEDACQAFGATYKGKRVGSLGDAACFSFFPTKNLGTMGDGGMIATSDPQLAARLRRLRHHGSKKKYYHDSIGYNSRLDELHAAILLVSLTKIDEWNEARRRWAARYKEKLAGAGLTMPVEAADRTHIYHLFCVSSNQRDEVMTRLNQAGIQSGVYYPCPLHLQEVYQNLSYRPGDLPVAEHMASCLFALPMSPFLMESEQDVVINVLMNRGGR
ncbi:DegT/DnrJ/EryC1/StrS family aminotransferase [Aneurinibacillus terranovensis]|uniref:DegT/DnrJ/EryC1/StrS family aminotransferase n=1 Tax=Aneurinibacillus terranovensis TaxID=278991 RepID=UPI0003F7CA4C|nr:DegT/DnrJ/EryC1/StrS family aminotransferase [Aneurinibacillus terranovensis]